MLSMVLLGFALNLLSGATEAAVQVFEWRGWTSVGFYVHP